MKTYKTIEQEVNQIRLEIFEKTKDMSPDQYTDRVRKIGEEAAKKYGFQRVAKAELFRSPQQESNYTASDGTQTACSR